MKPDHPAYDRYSRMAFHVVEHWRTDVTEHDRREMAHHPANRFLLFCRPCGTFTVDLLELDQWPAKAERAPLVFATGTREDVLRSWSTAAKRLCKEMTEGRSTTEKIALASPDGQCRWVDPRHAMEIIERWERTTRKEWDRCEVGR